MYPDLVKVRIVVQIESNNMEEPMKHFCAPFICEAALCYEAGIDHPLNSLVIPFK